MNQLSLKVKLISSYFCLAVIILAVAAVGLVATSDTEKSLVKLGNESFPKVYALETIVGSLTVFQRIERSLLIAEYFTDEDERANQLSILEGNWQVVADAMADFEALPLTSEEKAQWQEVMQKWDRWKETYNNTIGLIKNVDIDDDEALEEAREKALDYSDSEARAAVVAARNAIINMESMVRERALITQENSQKRAASFKNTSIVVGAVGIVFALVFGFFISFSLSNSIRRVSRNLTESSEEVTTTSSYISDSSNRVAEGASSQAASLEETSASMEELTAMTQQNAENAQQADNLMKNTLGVINKANSLMEEMSISMEDISTASDETSKIIKTIDEIAFQTNLLALNAAVEAARAGEAGAGFAVVADEVRNLAMRAAEAAKNTSELLDGTVQKVNRGKEIVSKTNEVFKEVAGSGSKVGGLVGEIAVASSEQAKGLSQIRQAITQMDSVTQENSATSEESAAASQELKSQAETLMAMAVSLGNIIDGSGHKQSEMVRRPQRSTNKPAKPSAPEPKRVQAKKLPPPAPKKKEKRDPKDIIPMDDDDDFEDF